MHTTLDMIITKNMVIKKIGVNMNDAKWYYMRDNHTFRELKGDEKDFKMILMEEFLAGNTYGMLCTKTEPYERLKVHARSAKEFDEFWEKVKEAINTQAVAEPTEPVEVDYVKLIIESLQQLDIRMQNLEKLLK